MHIIELQKRLNVLEEKMYVVAIARAMKIDLPNKVRLKTLESEKIYSIWSFGLEGLESNGPGG